MYIYSIGHRGKQSRWNEERTAKREHEPAERKRHTNKNLHKENTINFPVEFVWNMKRNWLVFIHWIGWNSQLACFKQYVASNWHNPEKRRIKSHIISDMCFRSNEFFIHKCRRLFSGFPPPFPIRDYFAIFYWRKLIKQVPHRKDSKRIEAHWVKREMTRDKRRKEDDKQEERRQFCWIHHKSLLLLFTLPLLGTVPFAIFYPIIIIILCIMCVVLRKPSISN